MNTETLAEEGFVSFRGHNVWYRTVGDCEESGKLPAGLGITSPILAHSGWPGMPANPPPSRVSCSDLLGGAKGIQCASSGRRKRARKPQGPGAVPALCCIGAGVHTLGGIA